MVALIAKDPGTHAYIIFKRLLETPAPVAGPADPYLVCLLGSGNRRAFINRSKLRKYVKDLADQGGSRVLIVTGPSSSGKSYSWYLINHVKQIGGFWPHPIDLSTWSGPPAGPADVMREVAYRLGWETPPVDRTAHEDGQARTLLAWFTGKMGKEASRYWLVFDGLDGSTTTDASLRLVEGIATAAERGNAGELRVVLIEYARLLPEDVDPYVLREPIEKIGVAELRAFLQNAARDAGQRVDDSGLDLLVQELLGSPPHPQTISLPAVSPLAGNLARRFFQANGADHG